ncbi:MAG: hypothetical protein ABW195_05210, partial [Ilumatobacteraceae bacterium]
MADVHVGASVLDDGATGRSTVLVVATGVVVGRTGVVTDVVEPSSASPFEHATDDVITTRRTPAAHRPM